jgi:DNA-binding NarL/FixJ family response regulator
MNRDEPPAHRLDSVSRLHRAPESIRLVVADSYPILLDGIDRLFRSQPGFNVLACCSTGGETVRAVRRHRPDILLLDLALAQKDAFEVLEAICNDSSPRVILNAERFSQNDMLEATRLGVRGLILKSMPAILLVQCVRKVHRGAAWIEKSSMGRVVEQLVLRGKRNGEVSDRLTRREIEILRMVARGESNKRIANTLRVGESTVKAHIHHVYAKLGVKGRLALVLAVRDNGLPAMLPSGPASSSLLK